MPSRIRRLLPALSLTACACLVAAVSSCSSSPSGTHAQGGTQAQAVSDNTTVINFGDQQQDFETLLNASGALVGAPYKVNFVEFDSGPLVDAGFAAHRIDIGEMGDLPASLSVKSGLPLEAVAISEPIGASEYLLAKPGITSIAQLKGKPVAYTTGTAEQAFALRALAQASLTQKDVQQVNVSLLELGTVLDTGAADASVVSVEQKIDYQQNHPGAVVLATQDTVTPASYDYLLGTTAALSDPAKLAAITDLSKRIVKAENWEKTHQSAWVTDYYVDVEHQTPAVAQLILTAGGTTTYVPINTTVQAALQNVVTLMVGAGAWPAQFSVASLFNQAEATRYNTALQEVPQNG